MNRANESGNNPPHVSEFGFICSHLTRDQVALR